SLSSFKREFKDLFHTTPAKWLAQKRLEQAEMLLRSSDLSISEICYQVGLKNPSHFNRVFKEFYGLPPAQYKIVRRKS
ncbi:MAG: AraC family transcriptional regulator, partial [Bacteroidota bacterium]